jgi:hypothetical protein
MNEYYYPYYLHFLNLMWFTSHIKGDRDPTTIESDNVLLWTIKRKKNWVRNNVREYTTSYNYYTKIYTFNGKRYTLYDELVKDALSM